MAVMQSELQQKFFDATIDYNIGAGAANLIGDIIGGVLDVLDEDNPNDETEEGGTG